MALVVTPVPGNAARVECTGCEASTTLAIGTLSLRAFGRLVAQTEPVHSCGA